MWKSNETFRQHLCNAIGSRIDAVFDFKVQLIEQEIAKGWTCFLAREAWFRAHLPEPLINDLGRKYACEWLLTELNTAYGQPITTYRSEFIDDFLASVEHRGVYRNYLDVGTLDLEADVTPECVFDQTANSVTHALLEFHQRHFLYEIARDEVESIFAAGQRASRTPPFTRLYLGKKDSHRNESVPLANDLEFWRTLYSDGYYIASNPRDEMTPDWPMKLMGELGPDFAYSKRLSAKSRLVFVAENMEKPSWGIVFSKPGFGFFYPPSLVLLMPGAKKWSDSAVLFENIVKSDRGMQVYSARGIELCLLYMLPRYRNLISFYQPFVDAALVDCESISP